jgi:kinesin family protein 11
VIEQLSQGSTFVPYRDSILTRLIQDSFCGGTKTCLIATVNPSKTHQDETLSTLRFAEKVKNVMSNPRRSGISAQDDATVNRLQHEISFLKEILAR